MMPPYKAMLFAISSLPLISTLNTLFKISNIAAAIINITPQIKHKNVYAMVVNIKDTILGRLSDGDDSVISLFEF